MALEESISQFEIGNAQLISKGLYYIVEGFIGPRQIVELRRKRFELLDNNHNIDSTSPYVRLIRGSRGEGFEFDTSDIDVMVFEKGVIVFPQSSLVSIWKLTNYHTILRTENSSPGFVLVELMESIGMNEHIKRALVSRGCHNYLSSALYRDILQLSLDSTGVSIHGPCLTTTASHVDYDFSFCLYSPFWPDQGQSFITRSIRSGWPSESDLIDIIKEGCHLVPINSKIIRYNNLSDLEWRISFSLAEKRIMHSINHPQFLTYGLLKIVLNEILKRTEHTKDLFCSYHMKNALFWEISYGQSDWTIDNFFSKFWMVFRLLMQWVRDGYCPHFFVPERNMFLGKIYGLQQKHAIEFFESLCKKRVLFLLQCQSIEQDFRTMLNQPSLRIDLQFEYSHLNGGFESEIEMCKLRFALMFQTAIQIRNHNTAHKGLRHALMKGIREPEIETIIKMRVNYLVQKIAASYFENAVSNRKFHQRQATAMNILKKIKTFYLFGEFQIIKHLYISKQYEKTIEMISNIKDNLGIVMYEWHLRDDIVQMDRLSGLSYEDIIKRRILPQLQFTMDDTIEELKLECSEKEKCAVSPGIGVPPMVFLNFVLLLSFNEVHDTANRNKILREMYTFMTNGKEKHIHRTHRAISWQILGICQQICEQSKSAFLSYIKAMLDESNAFKEATKLRIKSLSTLSKS